MHKRTMTQIVGQLVGQTLTQAAQTLFGTHPIRHAGVIAFGFFLALVSVGSIQARHAVLDPAPSLQNPGFEGTYAPYNGDSNRLIAPNWVPWNIPPGPNDPSYVHQTPTYQAETNVASRIHNGSSAQEYYTLYGTFDAGVYQQVSVPAGSQLHFSAYLSVWSGDNDDPNTSANTGGVQVQVGIDPSGGADSTASSITWSAAQEFYDQYKQLSVDSTASASTITVFVRATVKTAVKHNNVFVDDAALQIQSPTATVLVPTVTPLLPSATPSDTLPPPTITRIPEVTETPTDTLPPTDTFTPVVTDTLTPGGFVTPTQEGTIPPTETPGGPSDTPAPILPTDTPQQLGGATDTPTVAATFIGPGITYTVQAGDTVYDLAIRFGTTMDAIISANGLNSDGFIVVGQVLIIPVQATSTPTFAPSSTPVVIYPTPGSYTPGGMTGPTVNGIGTYIVQPGDTFAGIAALYHTTPQALARLNGIINIAAIHPGQVLAVPGPGNNVGGVPPHPVVTGTMYVVRAGDNLYRISLRFNVSLTALMSANNIVNPNLIFVGEQLVIPH